MAEPAERENVLIEDLTLHPGFCSYPRGVETQRRRRPPATELPPGLRHVTSALNSLFEVARLRAGAAEKLPPQIIYFCYLVLVWVARCSPGLAWLQVRREAGYTWCCSPER